MLAEVGLILPPQTPAIPSAKEKLPLAFLRRVPKWIFAWVLSMATLIGFAALYPWLSIEQEYSSDPSNPFTETFSVVNHGYISAKSLYVICPRVFDIPEKHIHFEDIVEEPRKELAKSLGYEGRVSVPCTPHEFFNFGRKSFANVQFGVSVSYKLGWLPIRRHQSFHFLLTADPSGQYHWLYAG